MPQTGDPRGDGTGGSGQKLKAEFSREEIVELVFACSVFNFGNKFNITMRLDATEESKYPTGMTYPLEAPQVAAE